MTDPSEKALILLLEIDRQTYHNKLQYARNMTPEQRKITEERLRIVELEYQNIHHHAIYNTDTPQQQ